jgi:hypothetical protein
MAINFPNPAVDQQEHTFLGVKYKYNGATDAWEASGQAATTSHLNKFYYTCTAGQTVFTGIDDNGLTMQFTPQNIIVTLNGIILEDGSDYTATDGLSVTLTSGTVAGSELNVMAFTPFAVADAVPASTGGTFSGPLAVADKLTIGNYVLEYNAVDGTLDITGS